MINNKNLIITELKRLQVLNPKWSVEMVLEEIAGRKADSLIKEMGLIEDQWRNINELEVEEFICMSALSDRGTRLMPEGGDVIQGVLKKIGLKKMDGRKSVEKVLVDYFRVGLERQLIGEVQVKKDVVIKRDEERRDGSRFVVSAKKRGRSILEQALERTMPDEDGVVGARELDSTNFT